MKVDTVGCADPQHTTRAIPEDAPMDGQRGPQFAESANLTNFGSRRPPASPIKLRFDIGLEMASKKRSKGKRRGKHGSKHGKHERRQKRSRSTALVAERTQRGSNRDKWRDSRRRSKSRRRRSSTKVRNDNLQIAVSMKRDR